MGVLRSEDGGPSLVVEPERSRFPLCWQRWEGWGRGAATMRVGGFALSGFAESRGVRAERLRRESGSSR